MRDFTSSIMRRDRYRPGPSSATVKFRIERHALGPLSVRPVGPTVIFRIKPELHGSAAGAGLDAERSVHTAGRWVGVSPRSGRRSPIRVLPGAQPANTQPKPPPRVVAGCAPGRFLIASGARARRDPNPRPTTPKPQPNGPGHSPREGPPEAHLTLTLTFPDPPPDRREPTKRQPPTRAARLGRRRRYDPSPRGAQRRRADAQTRSNHQRPAKPRRGPVRSAAKHRDVGGQSAHP